MAKSKVIINFSRSRYSDMALIVLVGLILEKMTANEHFMEPQPTLMELTVAIANFLAAYNKSVDGSKEDTSLKNTAREELENILNQLGQYVQSASLGQEAKILSSGFDMRKKSEAVGPLEKPTGLVIRYGLNSGEATLECNAIPHARMYHFEYTEAPFTADSRWTSISNSKRHVELSGLKEAAKYHFRVTGEGVDPSRNWSEVLIKTML